MPALAPHSPLHTGYGRQRLCAFLDPLLLFSVMLSSLALAFLRLYQLTLSPAFAALGVRCRYGPSCSHYAMECVRAHGAWAGFWMSLARFCRCHPLGRSGYDPAPVQRPDAPAFAPWCMGDWAWKQPASLAEARERTPTAPGG